MRQDPFREAALADLPFRQPEDHDDAIGVAHTDRATVFSKLFLVNGDRDAFRDPP